MSQTPRAMFRRGRRQPIALVVLASVVVLPMLPPEHIHRGHAHTLVHRHFSPHTSATGSHVGHPGVEEGAPQWLADPTGALPHAESITAEASLSSQLLIPRATRHSRAAVPEPAVHGPPGRIFGDRAPPSNPT